MEIVIALFILITAISFNTAQKSVDEVALKQADNAAILALSEIPKNDVSLCERHGVPIIERDLSVPVIDGASADEQ
tara:strand:- start:3231 stop:3458 length:228 start_codon:yes stop_codon:yes gene_type:complete